MPSSSKTRPDFYLKISQTAVLNFTLQPRNHIKHLRNLASMQSLHMLFDSSLNENGRVSGNCDY